MDKQSIRIILIALILLGAGFGAHWLTTKSSQTSTAQTARIKAKIVNVDDVVSDPDKYKGDIGVEGTATKVDENNSTFTLGCRDACIMMPVKYRGLAPKEGMDIVAYGEVKKTEEGKYIFVAHEIEAK